MAAILPPCAAESQMGGGLFELPGARGFGVGLGVEALLVSGSATCT